MGRRWTDWWRRLKVGGLQAKCQTLYLQVFVTFLYIFFLLRKCKLLGQSRRKLARNRRVTRNASESKNIFKNDRSITYPRTPPFANNIGHSESGQSQSQTNQQVANKLNIPLLGFQTFDELASYLEAVIRSGISEEEKNGTVFFMGNTEQHWVLRFEKHLIHIGALPGRPRDRGPKT